MPRPRPRPRRRCCYCCCCCCWRVWVWVVVLELDETGAAIIEDSRLRQPCLDSIPARLAAASDCFRLRQLDRCPRSSARELVHRASGYKGPSLNRNRWPAFGSGRGAARGDAQVNLVPPPSLLSAGCASLSAARRRWRALNASLGPSCCLLVASRDHVETRATDVAAIFGRSRSHAFLFFVSSITSSRLRCDLQQQPRS